jgi:hypothetical protein
MLCATSLGYGARRVKLICAPQRIRCSVNWAKNRVERAPPTCDSFAPTANLNEERPMPSTRIVTGSWARGMEGRVIEAVQAALVSALKIPEKDRDVVIDTYDEMTRIVMTGRSQRYTRVEVTLPVDRWTPRRRFTRRW